MENKLIPLTEFVNRIDELVPREIDQMFDIWKLYQLGAIKRYSIFLSQPLKMEYFVPCDDEGNVLTEPAITTNPDGDSESRIIEYDEAKSKCLFEGFEAEYEKDGELFLESEAVDLYPKYWNGETIEMIVELGMLQDYVIKLSETALKQIYG